MGFTAALFLQMMSAGQIAAQTRSFDLGTGNASTTLREFARQAKVDVVMDRRDVQGVQTNEVSGLLEPRIALERMLEGTQLIFKEDLESGAFAVTRSENSSLDQTTQNTEPQIMEETEMNTKKNNWLRKLLAGFAATVLASGASTALAQEIEEESIYTLSPFQIQEHEEEGYTATSTLAGTRIKSDLADVGASIFVATKELLEDTGSTDAEDLLVYVAGVDVAGLGGNFGAGEVVSGVNGRSSTIAVTQRPNVPTRIRGLDDADLTREFYLTDIPFDSYNTSRITVNRGPNSVLFGLGSPAGIIDNSLLRPTFSDHTTFDFRYSRYDSTRASFDIGRVLENGKLGIRIAGVYDDEKFRQDPAFERTNRGYAAFDYKLFETPESNTNLRGFFETGESRSNRPRTDPPADQITGWWRTGKQIADWQVDWRAQDRTVFSIPGGGAFQIYAIHNEPGNSEVGGSGVPGAFTPLTLFRITDPIDPDLADALAASGRPWYLASFRGVPTFKDWAAGRARSSGHIPREEGGAFFLGNHILDSSIFDFHNLLLDGPTKGHIR